MKNLFLVALPLAAAAALAGCTVATPVAPQTAAAAEVASGKSFNSPVIIDYSFQPSDLDITVKPISYEGSACSFPLSLSQAFYSTFDAVNHQAFRHLVPSGTADAYRIRFELDSFDNSLVFAKRFFGATAVAHSDLTLRVSVLDPSSHEVTRQFVRGTGQMQLDVGSCNGGEPAVAGAVQKALREAAEDYAYRVVNALDIK